MEPIDIEYLLEDNQRVANFLTAGTQEDKQKFIDLLHAKIDREWEEMKADATAAGQRRVPRRPDIHLYVQDLEIDSSLISNRACDEHAKVIALPKSVTLGDIAFAS